MIDLSDIFGETNDAPANPREIFSLLNKEKRFSFLRDVQSDVLDAWFKDRDRRDTIIKLNTGGGKTTVGLLILQSCMNSGVFPAVFIAPDIYLAKQAVKEATSLGLAITEDEKDPAFRSGTKILVTNIYKIFNGKSVFGVGRGGVKIPIGAVVIDDAHACLATVSQQFRAIIPGSDELYSPLLEMFDGALREQSLPASIGIRNGDRNDYLEVPFWSIREKLEDLTALLHRHRANKNIEFVYPLICEHLANCRIVISGAGIEISPAYPLVSMIPAFGAAKRRIYMSATLADDSVFVTHFGARSADLSNPITPVASHAMGDRMILLPQDLNRELKRNEVQSLLVKLAKEHNVVVLSPSKRAAEDWETIADSVLVGDEVSRGVEQLRQGHVGLTVLINRYDGIDLPHNACRVLVIDGLPEASSLSERVDNSALGESKVGLRRHIERIEQGMGRGVRSAEDHCVVLLLGARLTERLLSQDGKAFLSSITAAQIDLAQKLGAKLAEGNIDDIEETIRMCLDQKQKWVEGSQRVRARVRPDTVLRLDETSIALREAFDLACVDDHAGAMATAGAEVEKAQEDAVRGWLLMREAFHADPVDATYAQSQLTKARNYSISVLRPRGGVAYRSLDRRLCKQAEQAQDALRLHLESVDRIRFVDALCEDLIYKPETSDVFEQAIDAAGKLIGLSCQRPEKVAGDGPDNLWHLSGNSFLVIECKNGAVSKEGISKDDLGQLEQSMSWFRRNYGTSTSTPVIIHPHKKLGPTASIPKGARVINPVLLKKFKAALQSYVKVLAMDDIGVRDVERVSKALHETGLEAGDFILNFTMDIQT
ncbi:MAG: DEAD/DEAH box helicase family protein [Paracoccus marcusii]